MMNCSTPAVYGLCGGEEKVTEDFPIQPHTPYAVSKAAADFYMFERIQTSGLKGFITRAFSNTGPRRGPNFCISSDAIQIARILKNQQEPIIKIGNMKAKRVIADVRDVVDAYYRLMIAYFDGKVRDGEVFHIAGDGLNEIQYYLDKMLSQANLQGKVKLELEPKFLRKVDIPVQIPDDSKVRAFLDWKPKISIEQTLEDLLKYWLKELDNGY